MTYNLMQCMALVLGVLLGYPIGIALKMKRSVDD